MSKLNTTGKVTLWIMYAISVLIHFHSISENYWLVTFIASTVIFLVAYYGTFQLNKRID